MSNGYVEEADQQMLMVDSQALAALRQYETAMIA